MDENYKPYYTIKEVIQIKNISEEKLYEMIREKIIPTEKIGLQLMIPASGVYEHLAKQECIAKVEKYFKQIKPELVKILEDAPKYGSCGINITFHEGQIYKISKLLESTKLEEKNGI